MSTISRQGEYDQTCQVVLPHPTGSQGGTPSTGPQRKLGKEASMYYSRQLALFDENLKSKLQSTTVPACVTTTHLFPVRKLQDSLPCTMYPNEFRRVRVRTQAGGSAGGSYKLEYGRYIEDDEIVIVDNVRNNEYKEARAFVQAGPRRTIPWAPGEVRAAIVTCGGLCPGLNNVIQGIFNTLHYNYQVDVIYGIRGGFRGLWDRAFRPWMELTPQMVADIHLQGGTILGSSRGGMDDEKVSLIVDSCIVYRVNHLYIIGGDGTHRGGLEISVEARRRGIKMSVTCIPKTIDNDIGTIDRSFGFNTAVAEARKAILSADIDARCAKNGIGIVKLMGRHAGYIAAHATLASTSADVCLIPEVPFILHGEGGLLAHLHRLLKDQGSAVVVVAEGAGADLVAASSEKDASGNTKLGDIGALLYRSINEHFGQLGVPVSVKYVDPSYMVRSVPADAQDAVFCLFLASHAVHGAMAGFTDFSVGMVNNRTVYMPIEVVCKSSPSYLNPKGSTWEHVMSMTHQPNWSVVTRSTTSNIVNATNTGNTNTVVNSTSPDNSNHSCSDVHATNEPTLSMPTPKAKL